MTKARDIATLLSTANGKIAGDNLDVSFENITDTGTEGTRVATGTTAERGSTAGQLRFNTETGLAEYYTGTEFKAIDTPPTINSVDVTNVETELGGTQTFVITGSLFNGSSTVKFRDNGGTLITPDTTTVNSDSQITVTKTRSSFSNANEPYDVIVTNPSGLEAVLDNQINVDNTPTWTTASGNIANISDDTDETHATVSATDADGDTISYSETTSVLSGAGLTLNSSSGTISGDPTDVASDTTYNFTLRATANSKTADRAFNIIVGKRDGSTANRAVSDGSELLALSKPEGNYYFKTGSSPAYQAYYTTDDGGGWTPLCAFSNFNSKYELWFGGTPGSTVKNTVDAIIGTETSSGTATSLTKNSFKIPAFWEKSVNHLLFKVSQNGNTGYARYSPNANQTMKYMMLNRTSTDSRQASSGTVEPMIGSITWRSGITNDGAWIATTGIVNEAVGGILAVVDGNVYTGEDSGWNGNITKTDTNRVYNLDGTDTDHTIWVFGKA